jgi:hypothetical protein
MMWSVASWRDTATPQAQDDLDRMLNVALPFAQEMISKRGEFVPYGAALSADGQARMVGSDPDEGQPADSSVLLDLLVNGLRQQRNDLRAVAIVADVRVQGDGDAIRAQLEHRDGHSMTVLLPYSVGEQGQVEYGALSAEPTQPTVWV